jgi:outer membrane receptor protein involved in Fe transport
MSGESFLSSPKYKMSVGGVYRFDDRLIFGTDVVYQSTAPSEYQFDANGKVTGERRSDNYVLVNFNTEYKVTKNVAVSAYVKNAFDKEYVTNNRSDDIIDVGAPRTVGMILRYDM